MLAHFQALSRWSRWESAFWLAWVVAFFVPNADLVLLSQILIWGLFALSLDLLLGLGEGQLRQVLQPQPLRRTEAGCGGHRHQDKSVRGRQRRRSWSSTGGLTSSFSAQPPSIRPLFRASTPRLCGTSSR